VESASADAFTKVYEPGSVEKLITVSAALATGTVTPGEMFTIPNAYPVDGISIHDAENHGTERLSLTGIVAQSSNIGAAQIVQRLGARALYRYLNLFGLGVPTAVRFPAQSSGLIPPLAGISPVRLATMAYGEGIAVTAAQMISAYNAIANGGVYVPPHLVKAFVGPDGHEHLARQPRPHRVVPKSVADEMTSILEQVVSAGTGTPAQVAGYAVAGKTGTAQLDGPHGYVAGRTVASFAGFAPAQHPAITVMVVIDNTSDYGAQAAAPAFAAIARDALTDLRIPPYGPQPPASPAALPQPVRAGAAQSTPPA
jgi:cell division protein FtsI (penicillin-binding protein 3)